MLAFVCARDMGAAAPMLEAEPRLSHSLALSGAAYCVLGDHACSAMRAIARRFGSQMFYSGKAFNQPIASWNTASVSNMSYVRSLPIA